MSNGANTPHNYFSVSPLMLFPNTLGEFKVFLRQQNGYVLYTTDNESFNDKHKRVLHDSGIKEIYIQSEQREQYDRYIERNLGGILDDDALPMEERAQVLLSASCSLIQESFDSRLPQTVSKRHYRRIISLVKNTLPFLSQENALKALSQFISHDYQTFSHCVQVFVLSASILNTYDVEPDIIEQCGVGALMHDLGKTRIPLKILNKPGKLTPEEREVVNQHPLHGISMCTGAALQHMTLNCILFHHERVDGAGYPSGMEGDEIPLPVRVLTVCDIYDAITSDRPYAKGVLPFNALKIMSEEMRSAIDLDVLKRLITILSGAEII